MPLNKIHWHVAVEKGSSEGLAEVANVTHIKADGISGRIERIYAEMSFHVEEDETIFMNGYQTWTACPEYSTSAKIRGLHGIPHFLIRQYAFDGYGDYHFVSYPNQNGVTHGFSWCWFRKGDHYRLLATLDEKPGWTMFQYNFSQQELKIERDCGGVTANGSYPLFDLFYAEGSEEEVFDAWFQQLGVHPITSEKLYGYSSWYNRYQNIDETAIREDLNGCQRILQKGDLFQIDDGWEPYVGDWLQEDKNKFPGGLKAVVDQIHAQGYEAGLWLAPFVAEEKSDLFQKHPDWLLRTDGKLFKCGCNWSGFYSLDFDNPEVIRYLKDVFHKVYDEWGFDLVKLDFLYGIAPYGNQRETRAARMIRAMEFLRDLSGDKKILGCGVPVMSCFGLVDYCRISCDVTLDWDDKFYMRLMHRERTSTKQAIGNIISRRDLNGRAYLSDPDVFFLRTENCKLSEKQKDQLAKLDALLGGVFLTSDDPSSYTEEMIERYREYRALTKGKVIHTKSLPAGGIEITYDLDGERKTISLFAK